jgi:hypothetical protein
MPFAEATRDDDCEPPDVGGLLAVAAGPLESGLKNSKVKGAIALDECAAKEPKPDHGIRLQRRSNGSLNGRLRPHGLRRL